jgi:DNA-binding GntR family transcriptional regulator
MAERTETPEFETKSEWAYRRLSEMIRDGELPPGSRLVLRRLADSFGLSEMPVREALRMLQRDGLVDFQSHRGAVVSPISGEEVIEGVSVRMWLEVLAVREAVPRHTRSSLAAVDRELGRAEDAAASGAGAKFSAANRAFHAAVEAPADELARTTIDELWNRVWHARRTLSLFVLVPEQIREAQAEHRSLAEAVVRGDADAAADAMARHRESSLAAWRKALARVAEPTARSGTRR